MRKLGFFTVCIGLMFLLVGCAAQRTPATNMTDIGKIDFSNAKSLKEAEDCSTFLLGIIGPFGDHSVMNAIKAGNLKTVKLVDYKRGYDILFSRSCVIVYGE